MDIQNIIEQSKKEPLPLEQLRSLATNPAAFGTDIIETFAAQAERRAVTAGDVLKGAETEQRDLLASEQRGYDKCMREAEQIRSLQRDVEARTTTQAFVPKTQTIETATEPTVGLALRADQSVFHEVRARGARHTSEPGAQSASLGRVVRAMAFGNRDNMTPLELRVMAEGTNAAGGFLVPDVISAHFIDRVRPQLAVERAGARFVPMSSDKVHMARLASGPGQSWKLENDPIAVGDLTLERITLDSKTLAVIVKASVELSEDAPNFAEVVERELAAAFAAEVDRVALRGSGTDPEPRGIRNQAGVTIITQGANGTAMTNYDALIDLIYTPVITGGVDPSKVSVILTGRSMKSLAKLKDSTGAPLSAPGAWPGARVFTTGNIADDTTTGTSTDTSEAYAGDFSQLLIGMRTSFKLEVSRQAADSTNSAFRNLQIWVRAYLRMDVAVERGSAFAVLTGIRP
jgi:HK97 family phage major capsid protein